MTNNQTGDLSTAVYLWDIALGNAAPAGDGSGNHAPSFNLSPTPCCSDVLMFMKIATPGDPLDPGACAATRPHYAVQNKQSEAQGKSYNPYLQSIRDGGTIYFSPDYGGDRVKAGCTTFLHVAMHESGHILSLGHTNVPKNLMVPEASGQESIGPGDQAGINAIYNLVG